MISLPLYAEVGLLVLGAYLAGCIAGALLRYVTAPAVPAAAAVRARPPVPRAAQPAPEPIPEAALPLPPPAPVPPALKTTPAQRLAASIEAAAQEKAALAAARASEQARLADEARLAEQAKAASEAAAMVAAAPPHAEASTAPPAGSDPAPPRPKAHSVFGKPEALSAPRDGVKDNLKLIKGIGPRIEKGLNDLGVFHFDQIATWDKKTIVWVETHFSFKGRIDRERWIVQARDMSKGAMKSFRSVRA